MWTFDLMINSQTGGANAIVFKTQIQTVLFPVFITSYRHLFLMFFLSKEFISLFISALSTSCFIFSILINLFFNGLSYFTDICILLPLQHSKYCFRGIFFPVYKQKQQKWKGWLLSFWQESCISGRLLILKLFHFNNSFKVVAPRCLAD